MKSGINSINWNFDNSYSKLPDSFKENIKPIKVRNPELVLLNEDLAKELNLNFSDVDKDELSALFAGNILPKDSITIAQAYAGHQFGHFTMLGDGRAVLIGEHVSRNKNRHDIQFKGSGKTAFSRNGDGRAALGPMLREYIISESMHNLNIPTTRGLAVVKTGETITREENLEGAILTRVASSHIRVGTFQYIAARNKRDELKILLDYVIKRHFPNIEDSKNKPIEFLKIVLQRQIDLVVNWMRVGFIHGVMNTDNMSISGETIDYGPCAFMDTYDPKTVFSSIDHQGRYAYCNQPIITKWNLARFAECLIPLIDKNQNRAVEIATEVLSSFEKKYEEKWIDMMSSKLGILKREDNNKILVLDLLTWMHEKKMDYTNTFCHLMNINIHKDKNFEDLYFQEWKKKWKNKLSDNNDLDKSIKLMKSFNPVVIPRNHKVEEVLEAANHNDFKPLNQFLEILRKPYENKSGILNYQIPNKSNKKYKTYCGT